MIKLKKVTLLIISLTFIISCGDNKNRKIDKESEKEIINTLFQNHNKARLNKDGKAVYNLSSEKVKIYYDSILQWSLNLPMDDLKKKYIVDQMNVLTARIVFKDSLKDMSSKSLMIKTFNSISMDDAQKNAIESMTLGSINFKNNNEANSSIGNTIAVKFIKEQGEWKYDFTTFIYYSDMQITRQLKAHNISNEEFILRFLSSPEIIKYSKKGFILLPEVYTPINKMK